MLQWARSYSYSRDKDHSTIGTKLTHKAKINSYRELSDIFYPIITRYWLRSCKIFSSPAMLNSTTMAGIINSAIRTRAKPPRPLSIRDIRCAERLALLWPCMQHDVRPFRIPRSSFTTSSFIGPWYHAALLFSGLGPIV